LTSKRRPEDDAPPPAVRGAGGEYRCWSARAMSCRNHKKAAVSRYVRKMPRETRICFACPSSNIGILPVSNIEPNQKKGAKVPPSLLPGWDM